MRKEAENWLLSSDYDFESAEVMYKTGRYSYAVFMCHQAVEKLLKALIITEKQELPPKSHNLRDLLQSTGIEVPGEIETIILKLNPHYIISRYPDAAGGPSYNAYNGELASEIMNITREAVRWLKRKIQ